MSQPVFGFFAEVSDGIIEEKLSVQRFILGLEGDGLETVLTKFGEAPVLIRIRPRAALAVESIGLIQLVERAQRVLHTRLTNAVLHHFFDRLRPSRDLVTISLHRAF